ncbi:MFS transporter [Nocardia higoensis]|uniref:MFS transporter n=1 Tax=Nocardia higoensis TaxID=228599 RepID=A0ABS0D5A8_9NOCA|nr:MFS transporter [Nocardia higoensis]MBF6353665.1 MFS transporter [Nocardia higoensis]
MTDTLRVPEGERTRSTRSGVLLVVLLAQFMAVLDATVVNVAAPTIRDHLHTSGAALQSIIAGYTIGYAVLLLTGARLGARFGHGRMFRVGLAAFTLASLACGLAGSATLLIAFRLLQGGSAALMIPQVMSIIQRTFTDGARARALGLYAAVTAGATVAGQIIGGVLVGADLFGTGWRPIFLINVPVGAVLLIAASHMLPSGRGDRERPLDIPGAAVVSAAVFALVVPLIFGHENHWPLWGWILSAAGVGLLGLFGILEHRTARAGRAPMISPRILRSPGLLPAGLAILLAMLSYAGFLFAMSLHLQTALHLTPAQAGAVFVPMGLSTAVGALTWRRFPPRIHPFLVPIGFTCAAIGYAAMALSLNAEDQVTVLLELELGFTGVAFGLGYSPLLTVVLSRVPVSDAADASGLLTTLLNLGQVLGVATLGSRYLSSTVSATSGSAVVTALFGASAAILLAAVTPALLRNRSTLRRGGRISLTTRRHE